MNPRHTIHLTYDPNAREKNARIAVLYALIDAEIDRAISIRANGADNEWSTFYRACQSDRGDEFPYTQYALVLSAEKWTLTTARNVNSFTCPQCGGTHEKVYTVRRVVADTCGAWGFFRINGELVSPSIVCDVDRLPRDSVELSDSDAAKFWHS